MQTKLKSVSKFKSKLAIAAFVFISNPAAQNVY